MKADCVPPRLFAGREARLADLERLPRSLWPGSLTHAEGELEARLAGLSQLRSALLAGDLPAAWAWPGPSLAAAFRQAMADLGLAGYCAGQESLVDTVLLSLVFHSDFIVDYRDRGADLAEAEAMAVAAFRADWQDRCDDLDALREVFGLLPEGSRHLRWDQLRGLLRSEGWQEVVRIRRLIEQLPELVTLIRGLGRARPTEVEDPHSQRQHEVIDQAVARQPRQRIVRIPDLPGETRGIQRADRIARMLPAEALLLGHPRLRLVWHARRAERALLCYEDDDRMAEIHLDEALTRRPQPEPMPASRLEMGPIILCVDTSGSMQGGAEAVAKAIVLEAVRTAHAQQRACHVLAFGGPDEIVDLELAVDGPGIERLVGFLGQAFRGGTDICGPLEQAITRLADERWQLADLLLASDGEFGATAAVVARLDACKRELGLRVQGILIGDRETIGLLEVADAIHWVRDWRRFGTSDSASPVHSKSLTSLYFPGALRSGENKQATVDALTASGAVRAALHRGEVPSPAPAPDRKTS